MHSELDRPKSRLTQNHGVDTPVQSWRTQSLLEGKDVLVVEDDPIFRNMIVGFLKSQGCQVREAEDGLEGLRALRDAIPDILLCDLSMPVMTGMEFVEEIAAQYPMLPVIVISGTGDMGDVATALRHGVKDFLIKPLENIMVLKSAMLSVLKSQDSSVAEQDFSNTWFNVADDGGAVDEELEWHIKELQDNPKAARELLMGLMPETQSRQGDWQLNYCVLQPADVQPVLLDYTWLMDGRLAFYLVDSAVGKNSTATTLLIRAFFNDYLRTRMAEESDLNHLVSLIEKGMYQSGYASPIRGVFGMFDACDRSLQVLSTGLGAQLQTSDSTQSVPVQAWLGDHASKNSVSKMYLPESGGRLSLSEIGSASFSVTIKRCGL